MPDGSAFRWWMASVQVALTLLFLRVTISSTSRDVRAGARLWLVFDVILLAAVVFTAASAVLTVRVLARDALMRRRLKASYLAKAADERARLNPTVFDA